MHKTNHVPNQTHTHREPLEVGIIQASPACKWQNGLFDEDLHQKQAQKPIQKPIEKLIEEQDPEPPDPLSALPGFFMDTVPPNGIGGYKYPAGCVIFKVAFKHKGRRFSKSIGHDGEMSVAEARAIAAQIIGDVKTGRRHKLITPKERRVDNFGKLFFKRHQHNWKPVTLAGSQRVFTDYLMPWFNGHEVDHITSADVRQWFAALQFASPRLVIFSSAICMRVSTARI